MKRATQWIANAGLMLSTALRLARRDPHRLAARISRLSGSPSRSPLRRLDIAIALDRYDDARAALSALDRDDPRRAGAELAMAHLGGRLSEVAARESSRLDRRGRRAVRGAELDLADLAPWAPAGERITGRDSGGSGVLHVVTNALPQVQAGYTLRTHRVVMAQRELGLAPSVVTRLGFPVAQGHPAGHDDVVDGMRYHHLLPAWAPRDGRAAYARMLTSYARQERPRLIHAATDFHNGQAAIDAGRSLGLPVVYEVRGFLEDSWATRHGGAAAMSSDRYALARARETEVMLAADAVITLGTSMADEIRSRGVGGVHVVPNGVDESYLSPTRDARAMREFLGLPECDLWVGAITTLYSFEGLDTLIGAVRRARQGGADIRLAVVGSGPDEPRLRDLARGDAGVRFVGQVPHDRVIDWYDAVDCVAIPRRDARVTRLVTPLKPVEALARGRAVIVSDLPALLEATGGHAITVPPDDEAALEAALTSLPVDHPAPSAHAGREWVRGERTWNGVCAAYLDAYAALP